MTSRLEYPKATTLVDLLRTRADRKGDAPLYRYLLDGELGGRQDSCTYAGLDHQARAIAAWLQGQGMTGQRALLIFPHGLDFVRAFFGCLYAGVVPVPTYPPHPAQLDRTLARLHNVVRDAQAEVVLSVEAIVRSVRELPGTPPQIAALRWVAVESIPDELASGWRAPDIQPDTLALLQYTSGSTSAPKGVMVSHGNILHNQLKLSKAMGHDLEYLAQRQGELLSSWMPMFHDLGLIGMVLNPMYLGGEGTFLSPLDFLRKPLRWLAATSQLRTYMTGAPNFAFEMCVRSISEAERDTLDLSHLEIAFCAAETIRWQTLNRFASHFGPCGFRPEISYHAYGLAEVTLFLSGGHPTPQPVRVEFLDKPALHADKVVVRTASDPNVVPLLGCGAPPADESLRIVDPELGTACGPDEVGEIWYASPSVARGYWNNPELTAKVFQARLPGSSDGPFLRTGDLGFMHDGELFVTGRLKDLIIIKGRNFYPHDIELTVEASHPVIRPGCAAAFSLDVDDEEVLVVLAEVREDHDRKSLDDARTEIARSVWLHHDIDVWAIELLPRGALHKTTSGKLQRQLCRKSFVASKLPLLEGGSYRRRHRSPDRTSTMAGPPSEDSPQGRLEEQVGFIFSDVLGRSRVGRDEHFLDLGGHSLLAVQLIARLNRSLHVTLSLRTLIEHPTVASLAGFIATHRTELISLVEPSARVVPDAAKRHEPFPLTDVQQAYLIGRSPDFELGGVATHVYFEFEREDLDLDRLQGALRRLIERHDALRTTFSAGLQCVLSEVPPYEMARRDFRDLGESQRRAALASVRARLSHRVSDPATWPLFEIAASRLTDARTRLHVSWDMLVVDAWSLGILQRELAQLYADADAALPEVGVSFRDYVCTLPQLARSTQFTRSRDYWLARVDSLPPGPQLPLATAPSSQRKPKFERRSTTLDAKRWAALRAAAARAQVTPSVVLLSAFATVLARWSRSPHFTLSLTFFNRPEIHPHINRVVGDFTSLVLHEVDARPAEDFLSFAQRLQSRLWEDLHHREFTGVQLLRELSRRRQGHQLFAPIVFTSTLGLDDDFSLDAGPFGQAVYGVTQTPQVWLDHQVRAIDGGVQLDWDSVVGLFPEKLLDDLHGAYTALLHRLVKEPDAWRDIHLDILPTHQREQRDRINGSTVGTHELAVPPAGLLHEGFLQQARNHPDATAIRSAQACLSYGELHRLVNHYSLELRERGAKPNTLVAIVMNKGWEQPTAALAVLLSGAAYVPIDARWPKARRDALLARGNVRLVLTQPRVKEALCWPEDVETITVEQDPASLGDPEVCSVQVDTDLAYVIFTSGSSGQPKGVMIDHRGAKNTIDDINDRFSVGPDDSILGVSSLSFDLSVYDVFGILAAGGTLVLPEPDDSADPDRWIELLRSHAITVWNSVPSLMQLCVDRLDETGQPMPASLRTILLSGDWIGMRLAHRLLDEKDVDLISLGGATEGSIWSIYYVVDELQKRWTSVPYGWPLRNQSMHVLDPNLDVCPTWVPGEICIGGVGVAKGYWAEPALTAASFIELPSSGERVFRTGDMGRYLPNGSIEILGREDLQVKVSGHRIELPEVESVVRQSSLVRDAVVVVREVSHDSTNPSNVHRSLVAFVVKDLAAPLAQADDGASWETELRHFCESRLPEYMVPRAFIQIESLPMSANGKIDRSALGRGGLPNPPDGHHCNAPTPTRVDGDREVADTVMRLIAEVAGDTCQVTDRDTVFGDYGFDSMMGLRLRSRLERAFALPLPATLIWRFSTPNKLIAHVRAMLEGTDEDRPASSTTLAHRQDIAGAASSPIAIIGMSCRFPGGDSPEEFWRSLRDGVDSVIDVSTRWTELGVEPGPTPSWAGLLPDVTQFDAEFFGITPREAFNLDPQQRLLLEVSWEALERSGIVPASLRGSRTGVFVGAMYLDFQHLLSQGAIDDLDQFATSGSGLSFLAGRLSYFFGLEGPSMTIDTACSSSLVAMHEACESLRRGESDLVLTGGVSLLLSPSVMEVIGKTQALSKDGRCRTFDEAANGFVRGEGCGVVVLKRLDDAQRDGDNILACIRGSAVNQDGRSTGLTAPNVQSQIDLHRLALNRAGVRPEQVTFIETHGTGTSLGDPIELEALGEVYGVPTARRSPCWLGALKTNIGHLEPAAGVASVIKTVLAMSHGEVPKNLHFRALNPMIQMDERAFALPQKTERWRVGEEGKFAAVSAFGLSGTNAHVVMQQAPHSSLSSDPDLPVPVLIPLSARSPAALLQQVEAVHDLVMAEPDLDVNAIAGSLATERTHFSSRLAIQAGDRQQLEERLGALRRDGSASSVFKAASGGPPVAPMAFLFSGQGAQYPGMGRGLYEAEPVFADTLRACAEVLDPLLPQPLLSVLFAEQGTPEAALLNQTGFTQPALFALEMAVFRLWQSIGVRPGLLLGHSVGEVVAACVAGVFSLEHGLRLIAARGRLMQALPLNGAMVSIAAEEEAVVEAIRRNGATDTVSVAGCNAHNQTVISGVESDALRVADDFSRLGAQTKRLPVSHAFHSPLMDPILEAFRQVVEAVDFQPPRIPVVSNLTGKLVEDEFAMPEYWVRQIREPVRFADGVDTLWRQGVRTFVEVGPHPVLVALTAATVPDPAATLRLPSLRRRRADRSVFLDSVTRLFVGGCDIDWKAMHGDRPRGSVPLPTYPFQRRAFWMSVAGKAMSDRGAAAASPVLDDSLQQSLIEATWREVTQRKVPDTGPVGRWMILADQRGLGSRLQQLVEERGGTVVPVAANMTAGAEEASIDPRSPQDVRSALEKALAEGPLQAIVQLWGLDDVGLEAPSGASGAELSEVGIRGWAGALHVAQALEALQLRNPPRLVVVTRQAQPVSRSEQTAPEQALLWGLAGTIFTEHPEWRCLRVDVSDPNSPVEAKALLEQVLSADAEDQVALRQTRQFVCRLVECSLPPVLDHPATLRKDGTYLITGGLGGLGLSIASWMASEGAGHLVLMGRGDAETLEQKEAIDRMERAGARVTVACVDVAEHDQLARSLEKLRGDSHPLRGLVHAAGRFDIGLLTEQSVARVQEVTAAKVAGSWNLHQLTSGDPLDFFVLYSSAASLLGSLRLGPYVAGNTFLDALAHHRRNQGLVGTSINWASFIDVGLATTPKFQEYRLLSQGVRPLSARDGTRVFEAVLRTAPVQVGVAALDARRLMEVFPQVTDWPYLSEVVSRESGGQKRAPDSSLQALLEDQPPRLRLEIMKSHIRNQVAEIIRLDPEAIEYDTQLMQLGVDSLMSMEIRSELEATVGRVLPPTIVWTYPTIHALAARCLELLDDPTTGPDAAEDAPQEADEKPMAYDDALELIDGILGRDDDD